MQEFARVYFGKTCGKAPSKYLMPRPGQPGKDNSALLLNSPTVVDRPLNHDSLYRLLQEIGVRAGVKDVPPIVFVTVLPSRICATAAMSSRFSRCWGTRISRWSSSTHKSRNLTVRTCIARPARRITGGDKRCAASSLPCCPATAATNGRIGSAKCRSTPSWLCCTRVVQPQALPARMLMAVPATTTMAISEMADWVIVRILAARDNGAVSVGLNATLVL